MRIKLIAANWKMHSPPAGWDAEGSPYLPHPDIDVVVFPPFLWIRDCVEAGVRTGGQYGHPEKSGAHTGSVSMAMLAEAGCSFVLCGHSERRREQHETDAEVVAQAVAALDAGMTPIVCVGETAEQRQHGEHRHAVERQLQRLPSGIVIAYEPVWAIGTGDTATPEQAQDMHAFIRSFLPEHEKQSTRIIYGGSVTGQNAAALLAEPDIDGALPGGASLKPEEFASIVKAANLA